MIIRFIFITSNNKNKNPYLVFSNSNNYYNCSSMQNKTPVALFIFSNDLDKYLPNIETERKLIEEALEHYDDSNRLKVITRTSVSIQELFRLFNRYSGRIVLFHFAGHADGKGLQFNQNIVNTENGKAEGIAELLKREVNNGILKFVFLNGCSTAAQVQQLKTIGVPNVIATHYPINDHQAVGFSNAFYRAWAKSDSLETAFETPLMTIQTAFETALAYLKTYYTVQITDDTRGFVFNIEEIETTVLWELFTSDGELTLDFEAAQESKAFNEYLTFRLIHAMKKHLPIQDFLADNGNDWEIEIQSQQKARKVIEDQFPWVISWELRRLFAIGSESFSQEKIDNYINHSLRTYRLILQLVNYTLITQLWDKKGIVLESSTITTFFKQKQTLPTAKHLALFHELRAVYIEQQVDFPFEELSAEQFQPKQEIFHRACEKLQALETIYHKSLQQEQHCFNIEKQLTTILEIFIFLTDFQLVSMRKIEYQRLRDRQDEPYYIKDFNVLGKRQPQQNKKQEHQRMVQYDKNPTDAYAIFLYNEKKRFNLFPFILDYNALINEPLNSKIYFYECREEKHGLRYFFIGGENEDILTYSGVNQKQGKNPILDNDNEEKLKVDIALEQFMAAYNALLNVEENFTPYQETTKAFIF